MATQTIIKLSKINITFNNRYADILSNLYWKNLCAAIIISKTLPVASSIAGTENDSKNKNITAINCSPGEKSSVLKPKWLFEVLECHLTNLNGKKIIRVVINNGTTCISTTFDIRDLRQANPHNIKNTINNHQSIANIWCADKLLYFSSRCFNHRFHRRIISPAT